MLAIVKSYAEKAATTLNIEQQKAISEKYS